MNPYFKSAFTKEKTVDGKIVYWFQTLYKQTKETYNTKPPFSVDGEPYLSDIQFRRFADMKDDILNIPEETHTQEVLKPILEQWIRDCSGAFVKPPTIAHCLSNVKSIYDEAYPATSIVSSEEEQDWLLQWIPTRIKVDAPKYEVYWAPSYKVPYTRPESEKIVMESAEDSIHEVEVQNPEKTYTILPQATRLHNGEWLQELTDIPLPFSDSPTLRLDIDVDVQRDKLRRRVRDARIRSKLARYRAERLAARYEQKFGSYPSEDEEEAQTEAETSGEE